MPLALITGGSRGFGRALARGLADRGWQLIMDGRNPEALRESAESIGPGATAVAGDVAHEAHRRDLAAAVSKAGRLDLLVNNASTLGISPLPGLDRYPAGALEAVFRTNVLAPLALSQALLPHLAPGAAIVNITSDAAVEAYEGWGGYGASKAALDQISAVLGAEHPKLRIYAFDPGDMDTAMHRAALP
ncbi:MAG: SDR family oxidoreductase, partial [Actinomycetota bacterium]